MTAIGDPYAPLKCGTSRVLVSTDAQMGVALNRVVEAIRELQAAHAELQREVEYLRSARDSA